MRSLCRAVLALVEEAAVVVSLALFLAMLWIWAVILSGHLPA